MKPKGIIQIAGGFIIGALLLSLFSASQKAVLGVNPFQMRGFAVPALFGGASGAAIGCLMYANKKLWQDKLQLEKGRLAELESLNEQLAREITERVWAETEIARLATVIEQAAVAVIITDLDGNILYANPHFETSTGYPVAEALGQNPRILKSGRQSPQFYQELWDAITAGRTWNGIFVNQRKDGELYHEEATIFPIRGPAGKTINYAAVKRDVTEQVQALEALRQAHERLEATLNALPDLLFEVDRHGRYLDFRAPHPELLYAPPETFLGRTVSQVLPAEAAGIINDALAQAARGGKHTGAVYALETPAGLGWFELSIAAKGDPAAPDGRFIALIRDITGRVRAEKEVRRLNAELEQRVVERTAQLKVANQELQAFSYSVSHDLRAPLRAMDGFSRILLEDYGPQLPSLAQHYLQVVRKNAQQMGRLIDDLLALSRLGRQPLTKRPVMPADLVRQVLEELSAGQEGRRVEIQIDDLPPCQADPALLKQVFINLISNALKFTQGRETARIEIGCQPCEGSVVYFVRDNGVGFDMRYANKLFGVFQRLHSADEYEGTGVGLAIVQRIIHRHGGRIWAKAEEGQGATFYFTPRGNADDD